MTVQHKSISEDQLHEPKGISTAPSGTTYVADGLGSGAFIGQVPEAPSDGILYGRRNGAWVIVPVAIGFTTYNANSVSHVAPPPVGKVVWNTSDQTLTTEIYISSINEEGVDIRHQLLNVFHTGKELFIYLATNQLEYQVYTLGVVTDNTTYLTMAVTYSRGSDVSFSNNALIVVYI